ncbi:DUF7683 domain-containing protein [Pseudomonas helleri]|uniref:DUF7683 domain-containing protein n=1 Tax=Pseudomonas helleri TaxID=1608996 RepID=UPI0038024B50
MKHVLMGVARNEDFASFDRELELSLPELTLIMGWSEDDDCLYDYLLTEQQISELQKSCSFELPSNLDLYLTCNS